jgi:uncharacterized membrane protein YeaQ/YmgE (transglycosylase-associated protein family)
MLPSLHLRLLNHYRQQIPHHTLRVSEEIVVSSVVKKSLPEVCKKFFTFILIFFSDAEKPLVVCGTVFAQKLRVKIILEVALMNLIIWLIVGGLIGWIASLIMGTDAQQGILLNIIVGVVGAFLAGMLLSPLLGISTINQNNFNLGAMLVSLLGA